MPTIKLTVQYDGTRFAGFQRQPNGLTVQEVLEEALRKVIGDPLFKIGAASGRTDAGVHARGQVVHFSSDRRIPIDRWPYALNQHLPPEVAVTGAELVPEGFHARYWASSKHYRYTIENQPFQSPLTRMYAYHWYQELDVSAMQQAATDLIGRHDFAAFRSAGGAAKTSVRTVQRLSVTVHQPFIQIDIQADGFLYNMVRIIAGTLLEVGAGRRSMESVQLALQTGERRYAGRTLPPHGLCLEFVHYHRIPPDFPEFS